MNRLYLNKLHKGQCKVSQYFVSEAMRLIQMSFDAGDVQHQVAG
jgi:hypothetical protein